MKYGKDQLHVSTLEIITLTQPSNFIIITSLNKCLVLTPARSQQEPISYVKNLLKSQALGSQVATIEIYFGLEWNASPCNNYSVGLRQHNSRA